MIMLYAKLFHEKNLKIENYFMVVLQTILKTYNIILKIIFFSNKNIIKYFVSRSSLFYTHTLNHGNITYNCIGRERLMN